MSALLAACGARGLPPAGPAEGEVDVGYGSRPAGEVTGAVTTISDQQVKDSKPKTIEEYLRGRVAGLQVIKGANGRTIYRVRGTNSLLSNQEPLFVVDGYQVAPGSRDATLRSIVPQDIRQVDVLKDVASTAIYGLRGAAGVIIITTNR